MYKYLLVFVINPTQVVWVVKPRGTLLYYVGMAAAI